MWTTSGPALAATFIDKKISHNARATIFFNMCRFSLMQVDQRTLYPRWDLHQKKFLPNLQDISEIPFQSKPSQMTKFHLMLLWILWYLLLRSTYLLNIWSRTFFSHCWQHAILHISHIGRFTLRVDIYCNGALTSSSTCALLFLLGNSSCYLINNYNLLNYKLMLISLGLRKTNQHKKTLILLWYQLLELWSKVSIR